MMGGNMWLEGRIAVVTGAANGIGSATARMYAAQGADVALLDRDAAGLARTREAVEKLGRRALAIEVDLLQTDPVVAAFATIRETLGPVDVLLNNVGQSAREKASTFRDSTLESWEFMLSICLRTTILCTHQVVADMQDRKRGRIVNISSDSAFIGSKSSAAYAAAKGGVIGFTRSLSRELAADGVTVNSVAPGPTKTLANELLPPALVAKSLSEIPMGAMCDPEDIAHAALFFSTDQSRFITGQTLIVNGGRWMT